MPHPSDDVFARGTDGDRHKRALNKAKAFGEVMGLGPDRLILPNHEERQQIIRAPISFNVFGGKSHGGTMVAEQVGPWVNRTHRFGELSESEDWDDL